MALTLSHADSFACSAAIAEVRAKAEQAMQTHDTEEALKALLEVRNACVRASVLIREARARVEDRQNDRVRRLCDGLSEHYRKLAEGGQP